MEGTTLVAPAQQEAINPIAEIAHLVFPETYKEPIVPASTETTDGAATNNTPAATTTQPAATPTTTTQEQIIDANEYLKSHLGFENLEAAKAAIAEYQKLKSTPQTATYEWKSDEAKRIASLVNEDKIDELAEYFQGKKTIKGLDTMNEEQQLKLWIKMQNPLYDQDLVDARFEYDYGFDESKFKDEDGNIKDQMAYRFAKIDAMQKKQNDIVKAKEFFNQYKSKIELPAIQQAQTAVDKEYEDYKASIAESNRIYETEVVPAINALTESDATFKVTLNDTNNSMNFEVSVVPDKADFDVAKSNALNLQDYLTSFYDEKGKINAARLQKMVLLEKNFDKYAQSIARQAVNAERARVLQKETPDVTRRDVSVVDDRPKTETEKNLEMAWKV